jgi:hypothetical protein
MLNGAYVLHTKYILCCFSRELENKQLQLEFVAHAL